MRIIALPDIILLCLRQMNVCTYEGAWHDSWELEVVVLRDALPVVQQVMHSLHVEALLDLGVRRVDDVQEYDSNQNAAPGIRAEPP